MIDGTENYEGWKIGYNFKSQKGLVTLGETEMDQSYYHGEQIKKIDKDMMFISNGIFTSCDLDHPHYFFFSPRMRVTIQDKIVAEPIYLYVADVAPASWENHNRVIASIDTVKRPARMERILNAPRFDLVIVDEAHHVSRIRYGKKQQVTMNYRLLEGLQGHTRDLLFLSATPHQGDNFQFWSLINLLDKNLFDSPEGMLTHRSLLNRVMVRRTKREVVDARGKALFVRRQVHTEEFRAGLARAALLRAAHRLPENWL